MKTTLILLLILAGGYVGLKQHRRIQVLETELADARQTAAAAEARLAAERQLAAQRQAEHASSALASPPRPAASDSSKKDNSWMWQKKKLDR